MEDTVQRIQPGEGRPNRLRWLRENRSHLTLEEMSRLTGFDVSTISKHESGDRGLTKEAVEVYAQIYKVASWELYFSTL